MRWWVDRVGRGLDHQGGHRTRASSAPRSRPNWSARAWAVGDSTCPLCSMTCSSRRRHTSGSKGRPSPLSSRQCSIRHASSASASRGAPISAHIARRPGSGAGNSSGASSHPAARPLPSAAVQNTVADSSRVGWSASRSWTSTPPSTCRRCGPARHRTRRAPRARRRRGHGSRTAVHRTPTSSGRCHGGRTRSPGAPRPAGRRRRRRRHAGGVGTHDQQQRGRLHRAGVPRPEPIAFPDVDELFHVLSIELARRRRSLAATVESVRRPPGCRMPDLHT